jgi:hypothetical protein
MGQKEVLLIFNVLDHFYQYRMCPQLDYKIFCLDCYIDPSISVTVILYLMVLSHGRAISKLILLYSLYNDAVGCYWRYCLKPFEVIS